MFSTSLVVSEAAAVVVDPLRVKAKEGVGGAMGESSGERRRVWCSFLNAARVFYGRESGFCPFVFIVNLESYRTH